MGELVRVAVEGGRSTRKALEVGICGEHGGEPGSVEFCHRTGLDYVSCSPFRVPVARLAAAHAAINEKRERTGTKTKTKAKKAAAKKVAKKVAAKKKTVKKSTVRKKTARKKKK